MQKNDIISYYLVRKSSVINDAVMKCRITKGDNSNMQWHMLKHWSLMLPKSLCDVANQENAFSSLNRILFFISKLRCFLAEPKYSLASKISKIKKLLLYKIFNFFK